MAEHTKTPWKIGAPHPNNACAYIVDADGREVATLYGGSDPGGQNEMGHWVRQPIRDANAAFIVRACNAHDELVAALKEGRRAIGDHNAPNDCYATGPLTGDPVRDLVECPACSFIALYDAAMLRARQEQSK